jgi:hypothetical protein
MVGRLQGDDVSRQAGLVSAELRDLYRFYRPSRHRFGHLDGQAPDLGR